MRITLARAALLTSADPPGALAALHELVPPSDEVREALSKFVLAPSFADSPYENVAPSDGAEWAGLGVGGLIAPFIGIKLIDLIVHNLLGA